MRISEIMRGSDVGSVRQDAALYVRQGCPTLQARAVSGMRPGGVKAFDARTWTAHAAGTHMGWQTSIARRVFPKEQRALARRKLRLALWVLAVGLIASSIVLWVLMALGASPY